MTHTKQNGNIIAIVTMFFIFAMISFVTNLAAPIGTIWSHSFEGNSVPGMMGNMMNFLAYLFMGIPAGNLLVKIGYKKTALWALAVGVAGLAVQYFSSVAGAGTVVFTLTDETSAAAIPVTLNFLIYLSGAFICGFCVCMLNVVVNPMLTILGGNSNKANQYIQTGGALSSLSATLTPFLVGALIGSLTKETSISHVTPLLWIGIGVFAVAFVIISFVNIPEPHIGKTGEKETFTHTPWNFRHTVMGFIGIFIYVGIEVGIPGTLNFYLSDRTAAGAGVEGDASAIAGAIVAIYWLLMLVGRTLSSAISGKVSTRAQLIAVSATAMLLVILAIFIPKNITMTMPGYSVANGIVLAQVPVSALLLVLCGLCTSVMWGGIFTLAVDGLGKYLARASGIFMMMVVGGGILPLMQQYIANACGYMSSYWLIVVLLAYLLYYGIAGHKNVNKNIPVT